MTHQQEPFIIDDLMTELLIYVKEQLQNAGKPNIEVDIYNYPNKPECRIKTDRETLRQILVILLDNAIELTDRGLIVFGYHVLDDNLVDFFVDDTGTGEYNDRLSVACDLIVQLGSLLNENNCKDIGASYSFTVECELFTLDKSQQNPPINSD